MKIGIQNNCGSFSDRWIEYCFQESIPYKLVNCYKSDIINQLLDCDAFIWHHHHSNYKDILFAKQLLFAVQQAGKIVFPDFNTNWHFDDKLGQKYLLESIGASFVPSYIFYTKKEALEWINSVNFPKVFKLRGGAGSTNVRLINSREEAKKLCEKAFGRGLKSDLNYFSDFQTKARNVIIKGGYLEKIKRLPSSLITIWTINRMTARDKGYIYFQDFIANNEYDTRVTIIGNRGFAFKRKVRKNDFRASGSGNIDYNASNINIRCVEVAFEVAKRLRSQSMAFDFVEDINSSPLITEVSYCYAPTAVKACIGHWDMNLNWHKGSMWPQDAIIEDVIAKIR